MDNNIGEARRSYEKTLQSGKFTQKDAADFFGVREGTYAHWEQGRGKLNGEILCAMADKYGCSVDYLLCRTQDPRPYPGFEKRTYSDKRQAAINGYYESLGEEGKETLHRVARGLGKDGANRIEKDGGECMGYKASMDA